MIPKRVCTLGQHDMDTSDRSSPLINGSANLKRQKRGQVEGEIEASRDRWNPPSNTCHSLLPVLVMNKVNQECVESHHLIKVRCLALHTQERHSSTYSFLDQMSEQNQINHLRQHMTKVPGRWGRVGHHAHIRQGIQCIIVAGLLVGGPPCLCLHHATGKCVCACITPPCGHLMGLCH